MTASTMQYLTQHPPPGRAPKRKRGMCLACLSVVNSCRETPGPIPNPEAKPAHADGTATGRMWESKSPPTPNNKHNKIQQEEDGIPPSSSFVLLASPAGTSRRSQHARVGLRLLHRFIHNCLRPTRRPHITRTAYGSASLAVGNQPSTCPFTPAAMRAATPGIPAGLGRPNRT